MVSPDHLKKQSRNSFVFTCLTCSVIILVFFIITYLRNTHSGLPIGWDTPHYINQMLLASRKGILALMQQTAYYNFGYGMISSILVIAGFSPFHIEIGLPIILCILIVIISGILAKKFSKEEKISVFTIVFATTWFAVYRLGSDLHSNLLTLVFLLASSYFFLLRFERESGKLKWLWFCPLLILASFVHVETTIFFAFILLISALLSYLRNYRTTAAKYSFRRLILDSTLIILFMLPSIVIFFTQFNSLLTQAEGIVVSYPPLKITQWISYIGIFSPIAILVFLLKILKNFRKNHSPFEDFVITWAFLSIVIALAHYIIPTMMIFSERALILFPTPFIYGIGLEIIIKNIPKSGIKYSHIILNSSIIRLTKKMRTLESLISNFSGDIGKVFLCLILITWIFISSFSLTTYYVKPALMVYIPSSGYEKLTWLSNYYQLSRPPIFVYDDYDQYAGGLANLYSNWIQVTYGDHYSYLGDVNSLLSLRETPFKSTQSQVFSKIFLNDMITDNVFNKTKLLQHQIIIISDFYLPRPFPIYYSIGFNEISDGIYVIDPQKVMNKNNFYLPLYCKILSETSSLGWYIIPRDWSESIYSLEFYDQEPSNPIHSDFLIGIDKPGNYSFVLKYFDVANASNLILEINGEFLGEISYRGTLQPAKFTGYFEFSSADIYTFRIISEYVPNQTQHVSLDYLEIFPLMN